PFDGGVSCLVGVAVLYGLKKAHNRKKNAGEDTLVL
ncbi:MAG: PID-CTERM protein-sorting domain-containing protein, partial [Segetibacter sp.]